MLDFDLFVDKCDLMDSNIGIDKRFTDKELEKEELLSIPFEIKQLFSTAVGVKGEKKMKKK